MLQETVVVCSAGGVVCRCPQLIEAGFYGSQDESTKAGESGGVGDLLLALMLHTHIHIILKCCSIYNKQMCVSTVGEGTIHFGTKN